MAFSSQGLEQALDSLGTSLIDGVTVKIADKYCVKYDLGEVENILRKPPPQILGGDNHYDSTFEKKVLEDLENKRLKRIKDEQDRRELIENYEKEKAEQLEKARKEEEGKALEDERIRLEEIEKERSKQVEKLEEENRISVAAQVEQRRIEEAEWKTFEEERHKNNKIHEVESNSSEDSSKNDDEDTSTNAEEFSTPPQETVESIPTTSVPITINKIDVRGIQSEESSKQNIKINFEDFEALSDPFADLELKTINDLAELQSILTTNSNQSSMIGQQTSSIASVSTTGSSQPNYQYSQQFPSAGGIVYSPYYAPQPTSFPAHFPPPRFSNTATNLPYTTTSQPVYPGYAPYPAYRGYTPPSIPPTDPHKKLNTQSRSVSSDRRAEGNSSRSVSSDRRTERLKGATDEEESEGKEVGELKPSRSVGDLIGELQKEQKALDELKRKSVTSPIPPRPSSRGSTGLENWVPYPQIDTGQAKTNGIVQNKEEDFSCLSGLSESETATCKQLHEMGFSLSRLAKGCKAVGADDQKLINFCLVVDRLVDEGFSESDCEQVAVLHNAEDDVCRKHLRSFIQLAEIGFPSKDIHEALIAHSFDHQKALDQLLS